MNEAASQKWAEVAGLLAKSGIITELDTDALGAFVVAWSHWRGAIDSIAKDGAYYESTNGLRKLNPAVGVCRDASREILAWAAALGMTPAARRALHIEQPEAPEADDKARFFADREGM